VGGKVTFTRNTDLRIYNLYWRQDYGIGGDGFFETGDAKQHLIFFGPLGEGEVIFGIGNLLNFKAPIKTVIGPYLMAIETN